MQPGLKHSKIIQEFRITNFAAVTVKRTDRAQPKRIQCLIYTLKFPPNCESALYILAFAFAVHYLPLNIFVDFLKSFPITVRNVG